MKCLAAQVQTWTTNSTLCDIEIVFLLITMLLKRKPALGFCQDTHRVNSVVLKGNMYYCCEETSSKCVLLNLAWTCLILLNFTWKVSLSRRTMTPTVWGSNCTSSPHSCWPPASTPEAVSEHSCRSRGKTFNWNKKRQRTHNINCRILCVYITI